MKLIALAIALFAAVQAASAQDAPKKKLDYPVYGMGTLSCGQWVEARKTPNDAYAQAMTSWVLGYMTAAGYYIQDHPPIQSDVAGFRVALDEFCQKNPTEQLYVATFAIVLRMRHQ